MMMKRLESEKQPARGGQWEKTALQLVRQALGVMVEPYPSAGDGGVDAIATLPGGATTLFRFKHLGSGRGPAQSRDTNVVYVTRRATGAVHDELRRAGVSFVDLSGTVHLVLPGLLVDRTNLRTGGSRGAVRQYFNPFSDRGSLVVRTLMQNRNRIERVWGVRELAAAAGVSPATTTRVVRELEELSVVEVERVGRNAAVRLIDYAALLSAWTTAYDWTLNQRVAFDAPIGDPGRFVSRTAREWVGPRWALTLHAGAAQLAPHASWDRVHMYVDVTDHRELLRVGEERGWTPSRDGRVVLMKPFYRTSLWQGVQQAKGIPVASTLQLVLDLWGYPLRGREEAEHLLDTVPLTA